VFCGGQSQVDVDVLLGFCSDNRLQCHHLTLAAEHWVCHGTPLFIYAHEISLLLVVCPQNLQVLQKYILLSVILLVGNHRPVLTQVSIASFPLYFDETLPLHHPELTAQFVTNVYPSLSEKMNCMHASG
jgi:hypothetical protein